MITIKQPGFLTLRNLAVAISVGSVSTITHAINFNAGEIEGSFDSSLSIGASWATSDAAHDLVGTTNGGTSQSSTADDGRLNFKKGETFSKIFKGIHDLELKYGDTGVFVRGKYWYDFELKDEDRPFKQISDHNRKTPARSSGAEILDAFAYHNYAIDSQPGSVRLGKQVVSWGESTFISGGINSINPIDVAAFRRPGAEIKEGLIPVNMFYMSQSLTENISADAFYQLDWEQTSVDNCGTFFASDIVADGCDNNLTTGTSDGIAQIMPLAGFLHSTIVPEGLVVPRGGDKDARNSGQWGLAMRWLGEDTEYGAYIMNYHSRTPILSARTANAAAVGYALSTLLPLPGGGSLAGASLTGNGEYIFEYPEDIRLYGLSFATTLPTGTAMAGEISYRPNMPLQVNGVNILTRIAGDVFVALGNGSDPSSQEITGYKRKNVTQAQTTLTHIFDNVLGADRLTLVGEVGMTQIGNLEPRSEIQYGRSADYGLYSADNSKGFYTANSWGYRATGILAFNNVFAGVNLKPNVVWSHDVDGYGPTFNEGKAISVGLDADFATTYTASLSYTNFFGGDYNTNKDRDFLALSFGVNF